MKKTITIITGILLVLTMFSIVSAFSSDEDDEGNPFLETEDRVIAPQITIKDLLTLKPSIEPSNPELGMIYFDANSKRLKLYEGSGWYSIVLEKVSSVSKQQVKEKVEKKGEIETCDYSVDCGEWGDCINNYQSMTCIIIEENCNKYEDSETRDCVSEDSFELPSAAKGSHDVGVSEETTTESTTDSDEEITGEEETTPEPEEECSEVCREVCGEAECKEECAEESCNEQCSTDEEGNEQCEEVCEDPVCEEVCEDPVCEEVCEEICEIPEELFDITFDLEESSLGQSDELIVWITLQNFGKRYVPARLVYSITDETGKEIYRKFEEVRVYTDESIIKKFDDFVLKKGDYVLKMNVEYAGIVEEFSTDFTVETGIFNIIKRFFKRLF